MNATLLMGVLLRAQAGETGQDDGLTPRVDEGQLVAESDQVQEPPQTPPEPEPAGPIARAMEDAMPDTGVESVDSALEILSQSVGDLIDSIVRQMPQITIAVLVLIVTAILAAVARKTARGVFARARLRQSLKDLFTLLIGLGVWFVGLIVAAGIVFPGFGMGQLVATAGLVSIAVGFAFQDIFENFFAGILILWKFPFEPGDVIEIEAEGIVGRVEDIEIRMTLVRLMTGELMTIPNATVYKSPVRVLTNKPTRRQTVAAGVAYGEDVGEAREVIRKAVESCETVHKDKPIEIFLTGFGASSMDYEVTWWSGPTPLEQRRSRDEVVEAVKRGLDAAGIEIPYPYRTITFTRNEPLIYQTLGRNPAPDDD